MATYGLYIEGLKASDYAPIHGMLLKDITHNDVLIQLTIYSPNRVQYENLFAWAIYKIENGRYVLKDIQTVVFDANTPTPEQLLPNSEDLGIAFFKKLTDGSF